MNKQAFDILVIGAGPGGIAAASAAISAAISAAAKPGLKVALLDENPFAGGQIWRGGPRKAATPEAQGWFERLEKASGLTYLPETKVIAPLGEGRLLVETGSEATSSKATSSRTTSSGAGEITYGKLILATGARELFLPFPGWTLPGVSGAGGLQALVKGGLTIAGKRVVVAGSGPLLMAVAAYLKSKGAEIALVAEQAPLRKLARFGFGLVGSAAKTRQALGFGWQLRGIPYKTGAWVESADGTPTLESVTVRQGGKSWTVQCDYLACGYGLVPNLELPLALDCPVKNGFVTVDEWQQTGRPGIYAAGELTGIGGLEMALVEGQIAGLTAAGQDGEARLLFKEREKAKKFAEVLNQTFALRPELKRLARPETIICRCEDVRYRDLQNFSDSRSAKLQTRCGMGPCQGRVCGAATSYLFGWEPGQVRAPLKAARLGSLVLAEPASDTEKTGG